MFWFVLITILILCIFKFFKNRINSNRNEEAYRNIINLIAEHLKNN